MVYDCDLLVGCAFLIPVVTVACSVRVDDVILINGWLIVVATTPSKAVAPLIMASVRESIWVMLVAIPLILVAMLLTWMTLLPAVPIALRSLVRTGAAFAFMLWMVAVSLLSICLSPNNGTVYTFMSVMNVMVVTRLVTLLIDTLFFVWWGGLLVAW